MIKSKNPRKRFLAKLIFLLLILSILWTFETTSTIYSANTLSDKESVYNLIISSPIEITSDADFITLGFSGNGTEINPYIIENYDIDTMGANGILISGTTKYFIVRNCEVDALTTGIYVLNVASGTASVINNTCKFSEYGIRCESSSNELLEKNNCTFNDAYGIYTWNSSNLIFNENICHSNNMRGIYLQDSDYGVLTKNECNFNDEWGIYLVHSDNSTIENNVCNYNDNKGIFFWGSDSACIINNHIGLNDGYGVDLDLNSDHNIIYDNNFLDNSQGYTSQAKDDGDNNTWYDTSAQSGNYWSDWSGTGNYLVAGSAGSVDPYPLNNPAVSELYPAISLVLLLVFAIVIPTLLMKRRK